MTVTDLLWSGEEPEGTVEHPNGGRFALTTPMRESATEWLKANVRITSNKIQAVLEKKLGATKDVDWSRGKNGLNGYYWDVEALRAAWNKSMFPVDWPHRPEKKPAPF